MTCARLRPGAFLALTLVCASIRAYISRMRALFIILPVFALLAGAIWFAAYAWTYLGGEPIPAYGYVAMGGGILFSLLIGCGLMALVFYSSRHGYDDTGNNQKQND